MIKALGKTLIIKPIKKESDQKKILLIEEPLIYFEVLSCGEEVTNLSPGDQIMLRAFPSHKVPGQTEDIYAIQWEMAYAKVEE